MKQTCLAIADLFIPAEMMAEGLQALEEAGIDVTVKQWHHNSLEELQQANLEIEQGGSEAVFLPDNLLEDIEHYDIIITQFAPINRHVIEAATKATLIGVLRGGTENVHLKKAQERGIIVLNTPGRNARSVAEFTVGLLFAEMRNIARSHAAMQAGNWRKDFPNSAAVPELEGRTIGLVGFGHVGQLVGKFLQGFDARIIFFDPYFNGVTSFEQVDLNTLLHEADVVSLHGRLTEETAGMIGARELTQMKQTAILINTARSGLVKEPDLIHALKTNEIAGAAIDTFDHEPLGADSPFLKLDNVTITSHMAGSTADAFHNTPKKLAIRVLKWLNQA